ncbi:MAG: ABC transporter substrate-binding protein [Thermoplasmata archaeon]
MNRKILYAIIAVVIVIVLIVAVLEIMPSPTATMTVSVSSTTATVGQSLTFAAFISGGTPSRVVFNFGDGTTGTAKLLSGNEYTALHSYSSAGKYLVTVTATVNGKTLNNMQSIDEISITPASINPTVASEITLPSIISQTQIVAPGSTLSLTASTLQPPTATNWTIGYYIWNFGDGHTTTNYTVLNTSSGNFMPANISHVFSNPGIYAVTLGVITFNATNYIPYNYTLNGNVYDYYPLSDLASILSGGQYFNSTYISTIVVNSTAKLLKTTMPVTNPNEIIVTEVQPGGAYSFDPGIDYEVVGYEIITNVYEYLITFNGSTTQFIPMVATEVPTIANGGISSNYLNYTFNIRSGLKFSNGDPLTVWDVYASMVRSLLFVQGNSAPSGWMLAAPLLPGGGWAPGLYQNGTALYDNITHAITYSNTSQSITFHLLIPDPAFLDIFADLQFASIMDWNWLVAHGAGIDFTPSGFLSYEQYGNIANFNTYIRTNAMGSGPYMIKSYLLGQAITLVPNPNYTPIVGVPGYDHMANNTVYIQWEKDPSTALLMAESGQTDIVTGLPNYDFTIMSHLESQGRINITTFPTINLNGFGFNLDVNESMLSTLGTGYHIPQYYFANLDVRRAFAYAFDYNEYLNDIVGNAMYGENFSAGLDGAIPYGMPGYQSPSQLRSNGVNVPYYNLTIAKEYLEESGMYNVSIDFPAIALAGDTVNYAALAMWAQAIHSIDPNIVMTPMYLEFTQWIGYGVLNENPMPILFVGWSPDFVFPTDTINAFYQENGSYAPGSALNPTYIAMAGYPNESNTDALLNQYIADAERTGNVSLSLKYCELANEIGVNESFYVWTAQPNMIWYYSSNLRGVQYEENPLINTGADTLYIYLSK